jgi:hypothetical protein
MVVARLKENWKFKTKKRGEGQSTASKRMITRSLRGERRVFQVVERGARKQNSAQTADTTGPGPQILAFWS